MENAIKEVSSMLAQTPSAFSLKRDGNRYAFADESKEARETRKNSRKLLGDAWQQGAYNYDSISTKLRISTEEVTAILDEDWREKNGIV
jgi:hypothetical protein